MSREEETKRNVIEILRKKEREKAVTLPEGKETT